MPLMMRTAVQWSQTQILPASIACRPFKDGKTAETAEAERNRDDFFLWFLFSFFLCLNFIFLVVNRSAKCVEKCSDLFSAIENVSVVIVRNGERRCEIHLHT